MQFEKAIWQDHPQNPLVEPIKPDWMVADPSVLTPDKTPDGKWHMFANAIIQGIQHFVSDDGISWQRVAKKLFIGIRPYVFLENGIYYLFYEKPVTLRSSAIALRKSEDLVHWSEACVVCSPELKWESKWPLSTNGNPCLVKYQNKYRLYYSASWVFLRDCLFIEPLYISVAESDHIEGPYLKRKDPLIGAQNKPYFRNMGAGSMKVIPPENSGSPWYAFNNGIYRDTQGHSRSEIHLLKSNDGYDWQLIEGGPLLKPETGWKRALVYAMHVVEYNGEWRMYYNARSGWFIGKERIGCAILKDLSEV